MGENGKKARLVVELSPEEAAAIHGVLMLHIRDRFPPQSEAHKELVMLQKPLWSHHALFADSAWTEHGLSSTMGKIGAFAVEHGIGKGLGIPL